MLPAILLAFQTATAVASTVPLRPAQAHVEAKVAVEPSSATRAHAARAVKPPVLDGRDDDDVWRTAQPITAFRQFDPVEDGEPPMATEAKVAYDEKFVYVFVRAFDPHPDSIRSYLSRRDVKTPSDQIKILIDSYHDKRTGYEFAVNPAGVKRDYSMDGDGNEDDSWDGVWDVATRIDEKGWTAEFRIPLSQMRYVKRDGQIFGFGIMREIARSNVKVSWPVYRRSKTGLVSQLGEVSDLDQLGAPRRLEVTPYTVVKDLTNIRNDGTFAGRAQKFTGGADIKYGLTSNLTVDATINPDFGQVEADPSVLNLTSFEQYYQERRPFFLEGAGIFRYDLDCMDNTCSGLFYSRRIGRSPQLGYLYGDASTKQNTNILAAAKLTGRLGNGLSIGILDAATEQVKGPNGETVEPQSNYVVARVNQDFRGGNSVVGLMFTGVNRQLDRWSQDSLRRSGYVLGLDGRHRFGGNNYEVSGYVAESYVDGSASSITSTQESAVHNYQRPGSGLSLDTTRTSLGGYTSQLALAKTGGGIVRFFTSLKRTSPGFEINDAGFETRADAQSWNGWFALQYRTPTSWYQSAQVNLNGWASWNTAGLGTDLGGNVNAHAQLKNMWWLHAGYNWANLGKTWDDRVARGGPALPQLQTAFVWAGIETDMRWPVAPAIFVNARTKDASGTWNYSVDQQTTFRLSSRMQAQVGGSFFRQSKDAQWNGNFTDLTGTHYTFAHLEQTLTSVTTRLDFTATPTLSLQLYASPFMTSGQYTNWRQIADPNAANYADRFKPFTSQGDPGGFNFKQFRSNTVVRWEYRPGSTLFLVWTQGRTQDGVDVGSFQFDRDARSLFRAVPDNTLLIKSSYWFNW